MSYRADKQVIDTHTDTHTDRYTDRGDDNTRRPKLASGKNIFNSTETWTLAVKSLSGQCQNLTHEKSALVQVMACCLMAPRHYLSQCYPNLCCHMASLGHNEWIIPRIKVQLNCLNSNGNAAFNNASSEHRSFYFCDSWKTHLMTWLHFHLW